MMAGMAATTVPRETDLGRVRRARTYRRVAIAVIALFVLLGVAGVFGARSGTAAASGGGYSLVVTYPAVTRPGLAVRWSVEIRREGGLEEQVALATTSSYFDLFDFNQFYPQPSAETSDGSSNIWTFDTAGSEIIRITLDGRLEPARQEGAEAVSSILVGGRPVVSVRYETRVMP
jgi:hypothetical protein